jgi:positive regulator of sigma E activity
LEFSEVKYLFLAASIWLIIADMFYNNYRDGENCVLKIKYYNLKLPITLIWIIPLIITFICGLIVYQKLDSLDMNALRFFKQFIVFMIVSYFGSIILKRFFNRIKDKNTSRIMVVRRD